MSFPSKCGTKRKNSEEDDSSFVPVNVPLVHSENQTSSNYDPPQRPNAGLSITTSPYESEQEDAIELDEGQADQDNYTERDGVPTDEDWVNVELDSMWAEVCENLLSETEERELRDWETEEDDGDFVEVVDNITFEENYDHSDLTASVENMSKEETHLDDKNPTKYEQPLYPGAKVTIGAVMVLLSIFTIRYDVTGDAIVHLLKLLSLILPCGQILPKTLLNFKKFFSNLECPLIQHFYCNTCLTHVNKTEKRCPNPGCLKNLACPQAKAYFIEFPIVEQLRTFFLRDGFHDDIQHRFRRKKKNENHIEDIYDGTLYKKLSSKGILSCPDNVSFLLNTDGVPVFKSSKMSIWPLYFIINELPYAKRMSSENMIFAGLWFSEKKPAMWTFLKPYMQSLQTLENGVEIESSLKGTFLCQAVLLACSCDLPARCLLCNGMQFNGENGCWKCLQPGETIRTGAHGHCRGFPYQADNPKGPPRTNENVRQDSEKALTRANNGVTRYMVNGVKGPSWLSVLNNFDLVKGIAIDYMHGILLGVQKLLLTLWFSSKFSKSPFSISSKVEQVDIRLRQISPTSEIRRLPRSIDGHLKYWKASELRSFLLYYGLPVLYGILPDNNFNHYSLFVRAIYILLKDSISQAELAEAESLLDDFCKSFALLYADRFYTLNIHQLLHLVDDVRDLGPLYTHSCFTFEDKNGFILKLIHGTQSIDQQILSAVTLTQKLPHLRQECLPKDSELESLYLKLMRYPSPKFKTEILPDIYAVSATYQTILPPTEIDALSKFVGSACSTHRFLAFTRLEIGKSNSYICGLAYKRMQKRNCAVIKYQENNRISFAIIRYFIKYDSPSSESVYLAIAHPIVCTTRYNPKVHINRVVPYNDKDIVLVKVENILTNCLYISLDEQSEVAPAAYVCEFPNKIELD